MAQPVTEVFAVLFAAVNPLSKIVYFTALTADETPKQRFQVAVRACLTAFGILLAFSLFGDTFLRLLGIRIPSITIAGGMLLFVVALKLAIQGGNVKPDADHLSDTPDPAVFPLAMPLIAGPTSMVACLVLSSNAGADVAQNLLVIGVMSLVVAMTFGILLVAAQVTKFLGHGGVEVLTRVLGLILAGLAVQMTLDGLAKAGVLHLP